LEEKEMVTTDYTYSVKNSTASTAMGGTTTTSTVDYFHNNCTCGQCTGYHYWWYPYTYNTYGSTKYLYQILCPKPSCTGKFWAEIDEIKKCPVCKSRIKITDKESDYEVSINK
jgi:hypothetical protein